jgi:FkbM family methyltransferase
MSVFSRIALRLHTLVGMLEHNNLWLEIVRNPRLLFIKRRGSSLGYMLTYDWPWLRSEHIGTVIDIGANEGQFSVAIHALLPTARIYAFEPLRSCYERLRRNMAGVECFEAFNFALGDESGEVIMDEQEFSAASSLLPMTALHIGAFPYTTKSGSRRVSARIERLDDIMAGLPIVGNLLIKIDVQGFEDRVLRGGKQTVEQARILIIETSLELLYEGQPLFDDIYQLLIQWGFRYAGALNQVRHPQDGRILQSDSVFVRGI